MLCSPLRFTVSCVIILLLTSSCTSNEVSKQRYLESGNRFVERQDYKSATIEYRNALLKDPRFAEARRRLAESYEHLGDIPNASREFVRAADLSPEDDGLQLKAGEYLMLGRRFEDAKTRAQSVIERSPKNVRAQILLGNALAGTKDLSAALSVMEEAAANAGPAQSEPFTSVGYLQLARGKKEEAERAFKRAIEVDNRSMAAHLALANFYLAIDRVDAVEQPLKDALAIEPGHEMVNRVLASFYVAVNRRVDAEPYLKRAAEAGGAASRLALADYYVMMKRDRDARAVLQPLAADPATFSPATVRMADIAYRDGQADEARAGLAEVLRRDAKDVGALLARGRLLLGEKRVSEAIADLKAAISAAPRSIAAHSLLADAYRSVDDFDAAIAEYNEVLKLAPRSAAAQYELARLHLATGRADTSVQFAEQALKAEPRSAMARLVFARALTARREFGRAETELRNLLQAAPKSTVVTSALGTLMRANGNIEGARRQFEAALALDSTNFEAVAGLVQIDLSARRFDQVRRRLDARVASSPDDAEGLVFAASGYIQIGDAAKGEGLLRHVIEGNPSMFSPYMMLGRLYYSQNRLEEARKEFDVVASRKPDAVGAHTLLGMILQTQGKTDEAEQAYQKAINNNQYAAVAANNLAWLYATEGKNLDVALQLAQTAKSRLVDEPSVNDTLGWVYYKKGLFRQAVSAFEQSISKSPANAEFQFHLGLALLKAGDTDAAKGALNEALKLDPKFAGAEEARKALEELASE
jgi:tetratricopeptide (TPR) repeat protein